MSTGHAPDSHNSPAPTGTVLVTGGSGPSGVAVAAALHAAGFRVCTVGSDQDRIAAAAAQAGSGVTPFTADLATYDDVVRLRADVTASAGPVDAVIHLVGGWRGAKGLEDQTDADWDFLERGAVTTLRNVSRVFYADIARSPRGRFAMVSSTAVQRPTAATASYVAAKAAAEAWTMAMADGFKRDTAASQPAAGDPAAVVLVVKALVDADLRQKHPERTFPGATDVNDLAAAVVRLFAEPAEALNGTRLVLAP